MSGSRDLPSVPSSVTVIREPDGRYYASFVVKRGIARLPACDREVGIDLGLNSLAVTSDGEVIDNPRFLRKARRRLRRAQRVLPGRKAPRTGPRPGAVSRLCTAKSGTRVRPAHKDDLRLVRDNQAVYAEDLAVSRLMRTRMAKSVADAGWSQLMRCIEDKAARYGRSFARIGRVSPRARVLGLRGEGRSEAAQRPHLDLRSVRDGPRPRRGCREEHIGGRAGRQSKRL